jgi:hypothetical protein
MFGNSNEVSNVEFLGFWEFREACSSNAFRLTKGYYLFS